MNTPAVEVSSSTLSLVSAGPEESTSSSLAGLLPEVVSKIFMLDDTFFRAPFFREKLPPLLFSNGNSGFDRFFEELDTNGPRPSLPAPSATEVTDYGNNSREGNRQLSQAPWTSSAAELTINGNANNNGVIRNIPIRIQRTYSAQAQPPVFATQQRAPVSVPLQQPQFASVVQRQVPIQVASSSTLPPPSVTFRRPSISSVATAPPPKEDSSSTVEPDTVSFRSFQFPSEERASLNRKLTSSSLTSPPPPPQRRSFARLLGSNASVASTVTPPTPSGSTSTLREPFEPIRRQSAPSEDRPTSPMSQRARPKSPSLQTLKNGFRKATNCVRRPAESNDSDTEVFLQPASNKLPPPVPYQPHLVHDPAALYAAISKPAVQPKHVKDDLIDAVEEAIRSLETFDASKIIADAVHKQNQQSQSLSQKQQQHQQPPRPPPVQTAAPRSTDSDSDTGSVIMKRISSGTNASDSPTSSGIGTDAGDSPVKRSSVHSNRSLGDTASFSENQLTGNHGNLSLPPQSTSSTSASAPGVHNVPIVTAGSHIPVNSRLSYFTTPQMTDARKISSPITVKPQENPSKPSAPIPATVPQPSRSLPASVLQPVFQTPQSTSGASASIDSPFPSGDSDSDSAAMRKRLLCTQMTDCAKVIEINAVKINSITSAPNWRHPQLLHRTLPIVQDTVYTIDAALDELLEFTQRISLSRGDPKNEELAQLTAPLLTSQSLIHRLRELLDSTQWTLAALARSGYYAGNDSLDQFVAILQQLPKDCRKLVQWVYLLGTGPFPGGPSNITSPVHFLGRHSPASVPFPVTTPTPEQQPRVGQAPSRPPPPIIKQKPTQLTPLTVEEIAMDGGESTTSSTGSSGSDRPGALTPTLEDKDRDRTLVDGASSPSSEMGHVYEEDDLMSVLSESSAYQDHAFSELRHPRPPQTRLPISVVEPPPATLPVLSQRALQEVTEEEKELIRYYAPQLEQHTTGLCDRIDEFFSAVEQADGPAKFEQKAKLIIAEARTLVYVGDNMAQCVAAPAVHDELRRATTRLNTQLRQAVNNVQIAKDQYPSVQAVKSMLASVVALSDAAQGLKRLGKACY